jgi:hypothetical protein
MTCERESTTVLDIFTPSIGVLYKKHWRDHKKKIIFYGFRLHGTQSDVL